MRRILATAVSALALAGPGYSQDLKAKWPGADGAALTKLADGLGDRDYRTREEAGKRLGEAGSDALPALRAVAAAGNPEAADRAAALIAKIEKRLGNARDIAGTPVQLKAEEQTLGAALDTLKKQTGTAIQLNGDQSPRSKKVTPKAGKQIFWEALQGLLDATDLEVETSAAVPAPVNIQQLQMRSGDDVYDGPTPLPATGTVMIRAKQSKLANPVRISGAFRIEAIPVPVANLPQMPANRVPVLLQITPEPRFRWVGTTETLVTMAKNQDGHTLSWDFVAVDSGAAFNVYSGRAQLGRGKRYYGGPVHSTEFPVNQFQAYVKLAANPAGPSSSLKEFEGCVRGRIWSQPETMLAISELSGSLAEISGPNHTSLKAKYDPMPGDTSALLMTIVTTYNAGEVAPANGTSALANPDGLWLENGPGGRVKVKLTPEERQQAQGFTNAYGLALVDGNGKPMNLSPHTATQQNFYDGQTNASTFMVTAQYVVRPATKDDAGKPAKLTFSGSRVKTIEVPFAFKNVPVLLGTGTNVQPQQPGGYNEW